MKKIGIILPTWDNPQYLIPCVTSLFQPGTPEDLYHLYIVNNGNPNFIPKEYKESKNITVLQQEKNMGWEGGLKAGLEASSEEFVIFLNDDTYIPLFSTDWAERLLKHFDDPKVGAVGPSSNTVMGYQSIFAPNLTNVFNVNFLIGFCVALRRSALDEVGGVDTTLTGGDDLDLSIRLRKAGYKLVCDKTIFVYHHGFKSGERLLGGSSVKGGWNSVDKIERDAWGLMVKHGLPEYLECMRQV